MRRLFALLAFVLLAAAGHAVEDPSLQLYLDFESSESDSANLALILRDNSRNGLLVRFYNKGNRIALVQTKFTLALKACSIQPVRFSRTEFRSIRRVRV